MKILKKFLCLLLCVVFSFSLFSFTSCGSVTVEKVLAAVAKQKIKAISLNAGLDFAVKEGENSLSSSFDLDVKANLEKGSGDLVFSNVSTKNDEAKTTYNYLFVREGKVFSPETQEKTTDWSGVILKEEKSLSKQLEEFLSEHGLSAESILGEALQEEELIAALKESVTQGLTAAISYYEFMGAVSVTGDTLVVDLNKLLYALVSDAATVLASVKDDTTVADLLRHDTVKKHLEFFLRDVNATELQESLQTEIADRIANISLPDKVKADLNALAAIKPDASSSAYDYVIKVLCSDEFNAVLNDFYGSVFKHYFGEYFSTTDTKIGELLKDSLGENWQDELGDGFKGVTEKEFALNIEGLEIILKDLKQEFTVNNDFSVKSVAVSGSFSLKLGEETLMTLGMSYALGCSAKDVKLTDISKAVVNIEQFSFPDGVSEVFIHLHTAISSEKLSLPYISMSYSLYPVYKDNEVVGFDVYYLNEKMESSFDKRTGILSFNSNLEDVFISFYVELTIYENGIYVDIFGWENVANGYAYAFLSDGSVVTKTYTVKDYLAQN